MHTKRFIYSMIILFSAALSACSVGRNYNRPDLDIPQQYESTALPVDSSMATQTWNEFFTDTTLLRLIETALAHNFDGQLALRRIEMYHSYAKQARVAWLPALHLQASASTLNPSENSLNGISLSSFLGIDHLEDFTLGANISWEIDVWGKIRRQKEAALAEYLETYEAGRAVQTGIIAQVADAYYNLLMMDAQLAIARRNVLLSDSIVQMVQLQKAAGEVTELAVQQSTAQQQNAVLLIPQLEQAIALQENGLRLLLGDWPGTIIRSAELENLGSDSLFSTGVPADLLRYRPDVRASEQALMAANAQVGVAQGNMYPALRLTASGGLNAFEATNWFTVPASLFGMAAGNLLQPVFERRALKTQWEVAKTAREQRVISFRQTVTGAVHEVTNALIKLDKLQTRQQAASARVQTLELAVRNAQMLFQSGLANYLEVIAAQGSALQAELDKAMITRQQLNARLELYHALGGGWQ